MESVIQRWIIVTGNLADGFEFIGPFDDSEAAAEHAESTVHRIDTWFVAPVLQPLKDECQTQ